MPERKKRNIFLNVNKVQKFMLYPVLIACLLGCILSLLAIDYFYFDRNSVIYRYEFRHIKTLVICFISAFSFVLFLIAYVTYFISNKIVGPYSRIIEEMDEIIKGSKKGPLMVRKGDLMFTELLTRVNVIIEKAAG